MRDVAEAASVSISAVSLVVRGKPGVADETRERIWKTIEQLGYTVATPENAKTSSVGLLIERDSMPVILDIFYGDVIRGFQMEAQRLGYQVLLHMFDHAAESLDSLRTSLAGEVDGLVVANDGEITPEMVIQLEALEVPLVLVESYLTWQQLKFVLVDFFSDG
jgi:LacI family transcriptional regulator